MDPKKTGLLLRELRKEKGLTQEASAEALGVSNRSISRWENCTNLPDFDRIFEMARFYDISVAEVLEGKRKEKNMEQEKDSTLLKVAEYGNEEKLAFSRRLTYIFITGLIAFILFLLIDRGGLRAQSIYDNLADFLLGFVFAVLILGIVFTGREMKRIRAFKQRLLRRG